MISVFLIVTCKDPTYQECHLHKKHTQKVSFLAVIFIVTVGGSKLKSFCAYML